MKIKEKPAIVFLNAPSMHAVYKEDRCQIDANDVLARFFRPPISLMLLAGIAEDAGYIAYILDCPAQKYSFEMLRSFLKTTHPSFVVVNTSEQTEREDVISLRIAKIIGARTIAFGYHVTVLKSSFLSRFPWVDIIITKEAELTFKEILEKDNLETIKGICYKVDCNIVKANPERPFINDLDVLPFGSHHLIDFSKYKYPLSGKPFSVIQVSRGCPFGCKFCLAKYMNGIQFRTRSVEKVLDEIDHVVKDLAVTTFFLRADTFTLDKQWVRAFCLGILQRGLLISWFTNSRIDTIQKSLIPLMSAAGCQIIGIGIESGIQKHQLLLGKRIQLDRIDNIVKVMNKNGILSVVYFLIGQPFDTENSIIYNIHYSRKIHSTFVEFTPYVDFTVVELGGMKKNRPISPSIIKKWGKKGEILFYLRTRKMIEITTIVIRSAMRNIEHIPRLLFNALHFVIRMLKR
jgi:anaerobic magnesium-protoporphyrin IX monomethyl ester cyclase